MKKATLVIIASMLFVFSLATADIPRLINYQGMLTDDSGNPLSGPHNLTFMIYDDTTGGNLEWSEVQNGVQVDNGLFNITLGRVTLLDLTFDEQYWLEVQVGDSDTMPRLKFTSVGYAYRASVADSAVVAGSSGETGGGWVDDGTVVRLESGTDSVGIGTASPVSKLDVGGDINTSSSYKILGGKVLSTTGDNLFVGYGAGYSNTTGANNTFVGYCAGDNNTTGSSNIFLGPYAGRFNSSGNNNIVIGEFGSYWDSTGNGNTIIGTRAGHNNDTGSYNVFLGYEAGYNEAGSNKLYIANSETNPPLIYGDFSTGSVGITTTNPGQKLDVDLGNMIVQGTGSFDANGEEGVVYLGSVHHYIKGVYGFGVKIGTYVAGDVVSIEEISGDVGIGTTDPQGFKLAVGGNAAKSEGGTSWATFSDVRLKEINRSYEYGLSEISKLKPVRYHYKQDNELGLSSRQDQVGLVAQDVQNVIPDAVSENDQGYLMLNSDPIIWAMLNAIKELKSENEELKKRIERLEAE
jgi:hypothetical protein